MKTQLILAAIGCLLSTICASTHAQGTAFTYQGQLTAGANLANGSYDLTFALYDAASAGYQQGNLLTNSATVVSNGLFTVTLDFGNQFPGAARWLEIGVRTNGGGAFTTLNPRQLLTPAPYAITAGNVVSNGLASGTYGNAVVLNNSANQFNGAFMGNGGGLTNLNVATLGGLASSNFWQLGGNTISSGQFLGSLNGVPLDFYAGGVRALRLILRTDASDAYSNAPNVIGGSSVNQVSSGVVGGTVGGGGANDMSGNSDANMVTADFGTVSGGLANTIPGGSADYAFIGGGAGNINMGYTATVGGGAVNVVLGGGQYAFIGGGYGNTNSGDTATVGGGIYNNASSSFSTVCGGANNIASGYVAVVSGGYGNNASGDDATVSGGNGNTAGAIGSFIGGGGYDGTTLAGNLVNSKAATIGGGLGNHIPGGAIYAVIGGGAYNTNSGNSAMLGGGTNNTASGDYSTLSGGWNNTASGEVASVGGGANNTAGGSYATVPGGFQNTASGDFSFAAGAMAQAAHNGSFVWADDHVPSFSSTANNQFSARTLGGVRFVTAIDGSGNPTAGVKLNSGDTAWSSISDRNAKKNFQPVDTIAVLNKLAAIPVQQWNYKWEKDTDVPNLGPMAQDFKAAFYPGRDDKSISTLEFDGVELAAIQGLNEKVENGKQKAETQMEKLEAENAELKQRLEALEKVVLNQKSN